MLVQTSRPKELEDSFWGTLIFESVANHHNVNHDARRLLHSWMDNFTRTGNSSAMSTESNLQIFVGKGFRTKQPFKPLDVPRCPSLASLMATSNLATCSTILNPFRGAGGEYHKSGRVRNIEQENKRKTDQSSQSKDKPKSNHPTKPAGLYQ
jgi:hypothetical protein